MDLKMSHQGDWGDGSIGPHKPEGSAHCEKALHSGVRQPQCYGEPLELAASLIR